MRRTAPSTQTPRIPTPMAKIFLSLFLIIFGLNIPIWVTGILALIAGALLLMERFSVRVDKK